MGQFGPGDPGGQGTLAAVAVGSNLGDRQDHVRRALVGMLDLPETRVVAVSSWMETEPVGGPPGQGLYLNGAVLLRTTLSAEDLLAGLLDIEVRCGRDRSRAHRWGPRTLDLDILIYGELIVDSERLKIPHPRMFDRVFVLQPLAEVAPTLVVPGTAKTVAELLHGASSQRR